MSLLFEFCLENCSFNFSDISNSFSLKLWFLWWSISLLQFHSLTKYSELKRDQFQEGWHIVKVRNLIIYLIREPVIWIVLIKTQCVRSQGNFSTKLMLVFSFFSNFHPFSIYFLLKGLEGLREGGRTVYNASVQKLPFFLFLYVFYPWRNATIDI